MSLFSDYLEEMWGIQTLTKDGGFASYKFDGFECTIDDLYVAPKLRKQGLCFQMAREVEQIAIERGCKYLTCMTRSSIPNFETRVLVFTKFGFKQFKQEDDKHYFIKEISK